MSYIVARMEKLKSGNLGGIYKHNERIFEKHSNQDIDVSRSHLNYELTDRDRSVSYEKQIKDYIDRNKISRRATRADAVLCDEWIITSDQKFFEGLSEQETRRFFETAMDYFAQNYGWSNIAYASVHLDERTPHMHMGIVPMRNGKLSSKAMFTREELKKIQDELPKHMGRHGFELQRGELGSEKKHKTVAEFKKEIANQELGQELVKQFGAPEFINDMTGQFETRATFEAAQQLEHVGIKTQVRETTFQEKTDWVREQVSALKLSQNEAEAVLGQFDVKLEEKKGEVAKIASEASQSLQELDKVKDSINTLEKTKGGLEAEIGRLEQGLSSKQSQLAELLEGLKDFNWLSGNQLDLDKIGKKTLLGDYKVDEGMLKSVLKTALLQVQRNQKFSGELATARQENAVLKQRMARYDRIEQHKHEIELELIQTKGAYKRLANRYDNLMERHKLTSRKLQVWRSRAKEYMPLQEFKSLSKQINRYVPRFIPLAVKVVQKTKELGRSLGL